MQEIVVEVTESLRGGICMHVVGLMGTVWNLLTHTSIFLTPRNELLLLLQGDI